jgi:hypothetical protein
MFILSGVEQFTVGILARIITVTGVNAILSFALEGELSSYTVVLSCKGLPCTALRSHGFAEGITFKLIERTRIHRTLAGPHLGSSHSFGHGIAALRGISCRNLHIVKCLESVGFVSAPERADSTLRHEGNRSLAILGVMLSGLQGEGHWLLFLKVLVNCSAIGRRHERQHWLFGLLVFVLEEIVVREEAGVQVFEELVLEIFGLVGT